MSSPTLPATRRTRGRALLAAVVFALLALACGDQPAAPDTMAESGDLQAVGPDGQSVTGSGHITVDGVRRKFTISARKDADGGSSGQAQLMTANGAYTLHAAIDCAVFHGSLAVLSGVTTRETGFPPGAAVFFAVEDNGESADDPADRISLAFIGGSPIPNLCELLGVPPASFLLPVEQGNISVRD